MKSKPLFLILCLLATGFHLSATIRMVSNSPDAPPGYFTTLQSAHDAAVDDDTLYVNGSAMPYSQLFQCSKKLVIIGPGYFLDGNNPNTPVSYPAVIDAAIQFNRTDNLQPSSGSSGSQLIGIEHTASLTINSSNVMIIKCKLNRVYIMTQTNTIPPATGVQIFRNYFTGDGVLGSTGNPIVNAQIFNNIFTDDFELPDESSGAILHNLFTKTTPSNLSVTITNFVGEIRGNILNSSSSSGVNISAGGDPCQISHNTAANGQFGSACNNNTAAATALFVGATGNTTDGQWKLKANSPASGNAQDNTDRGPFGGSAPYCLSGVGSVPVITFLQMQPSGTPSNPIKVKIMAKSGN